MKSDRLTADELVSERGEAAPIDTAIDSHAHGYRWIILLVIWSAFTVSCVDRFAWASVAASVGHELGFALALLGSLTTAFYVGYTVSCPIGGVLADKLGSRATLALSMFPLAALTFCFGYVQSFTAAVALHAVMGFAAGAEYGATIKVLTVWFVRDKGRAFGIWATGTSVSVVLANATVPRIAELWGWRAAYQWLGVATFAFTLLCMLVVRNAPRRLVQARVTGAELASLLRSRALMLVAFAGAGALYGTLGFVAWANALLTVAHGVSQVKAGSVLMGFGVGAFLSKPLFGWLYDRWHTHARSMAIAVLLCFVTLLIAFGTCTSMTGYYLIAPFLGAAAYGYTPLLIGLYTRASGARLAGAAAGLVNTVWSVGSFVSPIVAGYVFAHGRSVDATLAVIAAGPLAGALVLAFAREDRRPGASEPGSGT
ncbi:MFS transporter [Caballeronia ptereochthonis]|uniref:D-galactonate transporter n=1 Tax=Caballeronia ptereochthonis TaxID=1777144 RepID=A0A158CEN7_9BURK|nr:MFS transporter [Caballeronia ptereochthonis]SAK79987.1 d-galactonate transporter [Caballeronia ptereochthonis]